MVNLVRFISERDVKAMSLVLKVSHRLDKLRTKRFELETNRDLVVRRLQQLQAQIALQRRKGSKDLLTSPIHVHSFSL